MMSPARVMESAFANLFFFLFCAQILSPYVAGVTIYLEVLVALINPFFIRWLARRVIRTQYLVLAAGICVAGVLSGPQLLVKATSIGVGVFFIFYAQERKLFFLLRYLGLSLLVATAQFALVLLDSPFAARIGPTYISAAIWGEYATPTYTNFFSIFLFPRVSGLSREAGFLASFLSVTTALIFIEWKRGIGVPKAGDVPLLGVGLVISLSRSTIGLPLLLALERLRRVIAAVPFFVVVASFFASLSGLTFLLADFLLREDNGSLLHRFGGYAVVFNVDAEHLMFGAPDLREVQSRFVYGLPEHLRGQFAGLAGIVLKYGLASTVVVLTAFYLGGISSVGIAFLLVSTANVDLLTNQNFVILSYYTVFRFYSRRVRLAG